MSSVSKRTTIYKSIRKRISEEAVCTKHNFNLQIYLKAMISGDQLYKNMQRVTGLFENTNSLHENVWSRYILHENAHILKNLDEKV